MPHARPESGALKLGFSLVTLKNPVRFGHQTNDPVDILLCLSAANKEQLNKEAIVSVMNLFDGEENIEQLRNARTHDDLLNLFNLIES
jgi:PTS system ascorbate-specific IIA component